MSTSDADDIIINVNQIQDEQTYSGVEELVIHKAESQCKNFFKNFQIL